ncbi:MAG: efflux transporter outer membrane subunit [Firmicutes bacterium]|nr:efflux transporter outer membrane subunit [Bacillota bacterium]
MSKNNHNFNKNNDTEKLSENQKGRIPIYRICLLFLPVFALFFASCYKETEYKRPPVSVPSSFRGTPDKNLNLIDPEKSGSLGNLFWWELLQDEELKKIIETAVINNYDVKIAAEKILQAQAQYGISQSGEYPVVNGNSSFTAAGSSRVANPYNPAPSPVNTHVFNTNLQAVFELDFWGKLKKTSEASMYDLLATEESRDTVLMSLVSEVALAYFTLRELDMELEVSKKTLASREKSLELVRARFEGNIATQLDVDQAQGLVYNAQKAIIKSEQLIAQQENYLCFLLGKNPGEIKRGIPLAAQIKEPVLPPGLPSDILENRPDIRMAEKQLIAAGIRVDVAKTAYFPTVTLNAIGGTLSREFTNLFTGPSYIWNFAPQATVPIFNGGNTASKVKVSESLQRQAVLTYEKSVVTAFREVSDSFIGYSKNHEFRLKQEAYTTTLANQSKIARLRYEGGVSSYLEVLDTERQYFTAELELSQAQYNELASIIKLYKALGGGWKQRQK